MNMAIIVGKNLHLIYRKETLNLSWDFLFFSEFKLKFVESPFFTLLFSFSYFIYSVFLLVAYLMVANLA